MLRRMRTRQSPRCPGQSAMAALASLRSRPEPIVATSLPRYPLACTPNQVFARPKQSIYVNTLCSSHSSDGTEEAGLYRAAANPLANFGHQVPQGDPVRTRRRERGCGQAGARGQARPGAGGSRSCRRNRVISLAWSDGGRSCTVTGPGRRTGRRWPVTCAQGRSWRRSAGKWGVGAVPAGEGSNPAPATTRSEARMGASPRGCLAGWRQPG
jgi:hypothetical protein